MANSTPKKRVKDIIATLEQGLVTTGIRWVMLVSVVTLFGTLSLLSAAGIVVSFFPWDVELFVGSVVLVPFSAIMFGILINPIIKIIKGYHKILGVFANRTLEILYSPKYEQIMFMKEFGFKTR